MFNQEFIRLWLWEHGVDGPHLNHVSNMCMGIRETLEGSDKHGSFVKAVAAKDWERAKQVADFVNKRYLAIVYRDFVELKDENELISQCFGTPKGYQYCEGCKTFVKIEEFPHDEAEKCTSCYQAHADMIYEQMREKMYEN